MTPRQRSRSQPPSAATGRDASRAVAASRPDPRRLGLPTAALALSLALAGCAGSGPGATATTTHQATASRTTQAAPGRPAAGATPSASAQALAHLPGLGPHTEAEIPADTRQVVLVTGRDKNSSDSQVALYERTGAGWQPKATWPARNALRGWTDDHHLDDLRSPIGVFTLTDAGGLLPDPGTKLPYHQSRSFTATGTGFDGEPLAGAFDYVVAIDYNRVPGTSPLDQTKPQGADKGGNIWLHVDHGGPTHACVALKKDAMRALLRALDPALHPVVVMGDAASLAR
ncbi:hypothetical protein [Streptomyces thermodiastaticus]|uniref:hypothetical protein n=1 Tax=Streptomyces thermodiastaticus TaxID=44061 RepID=UPI0019CE220E|nr:hypothetical protein [Streptomyces thermodiastaticus]MCE7550140.1 hypothetical protein [Streptomyces thermodiastaticus]GHF67684.1 hypothetical protein GCM10018787_15100 [Streptomyces thermodiastaticus]